MAKKESLADKYIKEQLEGLYTTCISKKITLAIVRYIKLKEKEFQEKIDDLKANCDLAIEGRDLEIKELKEQIDKLKCCENCDHRRLDSQFKSVCDFKYGKKIDNPLTCKCDNWEMYK